MINRVLCLSFLFFLLPSLNYLEAAMATPPAGEGMTLPDMPNLSEEELQKAFEELQTFFDSLSPEELAELEAIGRQALAEMGIDPDTMEAIGAPAPEAPQPATPTPAPAAPEPKKAVPVLNKNEIKKTLALLIEELSFLSAKAASSEATLHEPRLAEQKNAITKLLAYIKIINKSDHQDRLATAEFVPLYNQLFELAQALQQYQSSIVLHEVGMEEDDPYEILGIDESASPAAIEKAYKSLRDARDPAKIKEKLQEKNASQKDIARATKEAQMSVIILDEAFEALQDPRMREQIIRARAAKAKTIKETREKSHQAVNAILQTWRSLVQQGNLLVLIEEFLKKHAPEELAARKKIEAEEASRKKEQQAQGTLRGAPTPGSFDIPPRSATTQPGSSGGPRLPEQPPFGYEGHEPFPYPDYRPEPYEPEKESSKESSSSSKKSSLSTKKPLPPPAKKEPLPLPPKKPADTRGPGTSKPPADLYMQVLEVDEHLRRLGKEFSAQVADSLLAQKLAPAALQTKTEAVTNAQKSIAQLTNILSEDNSQSQRYYNQWQKIVAKPENSAALARLEQLTKDLNEQTAQGPSLALAAELAKLLDTVLALDGAIARGMAFTKEQVWQDQPGFEPKPQSVTELNLPKAAPVSVKK